MEKLILVPNPRKIIYETGSYLLESEKFIVIEQSDSKNLFSSASILKKVLSEKFNINWLITPITCLEPSKIGLRIKVLPEGIIAEQGYRLILNEEGIWLIGHDLAGIFYGITTLIQLLENYGLTLPSMRIDDYPDFKARGVMLDISRDRVPTMETLFSLVDLLSTLKYNQLQLYTEHTFAYSNHMKVWENASPMTGDEILQLDAYCKSKYIELVPNQNSFGHMNRWLQYFEYAHLAEVSGHFRTPWGQMEGSFSLCPVDPDSFNLLRELYGELLPHFQSRMINIGCDETWDLGQGRSKEVCAKFGVGQVYLDFLMKIYRELSTSRRTIQFWGDIILQHPELIIKLPKDMIALEWGYEADHPFNQNCELFNKSGIPFYVCPGTSSWNSIAGRTDNAIGNLKNAAINGMKHGSSGYLVTDWGDNGHWQQFPISYLGYVAGAAYSWAIETNHEINLKQVLNEYIFKDSANIIGEVVYDLGNIYRSLNYEIPNSSIFFSILQLPLKQLQGENRIEAKKFLEVRESISEISQRIKNAKINLPEKTLLSRELELSARLLRHACLRGAVSMNLHEPYNLYQDLLECMEEFKFLWLCRSRPGGLIDSLRRFDNAKSDYLTID